MINSFGATRRRGSAVGAAARPRRYLRSISARKASARILCCRCWWRAGWAIGGVRPHSRKREMAALTTSGWVTGPMCPSPSNSITSTRGSVLVSSRATPRDDAGESLPVMKRVGTSSAAKASRGVGSPSNAPAHPRTFTTELAIGPLRGSGVRAQAPGPIQKSMNHSAALAGSPASSAAAAPATAARIPSASFGGGDSASSSANKVGSYKASARTRCG